MGDGVTARNQWVCRSSALGAGPSDLTRALLGSTLLPAFGGLAIGTAVAVVAWKGTEALVYGVPPMYAAPMAQIVTGVFGVVIAAVLPAVVRAIRADPVRALKEL
jgi:hypothetical protein